MNNDNGKNDFNRTTSSPESVGPQRGDQFYDPKRKRQYIYEGPDEVFEGKHKFISDQGRTFVGNVNDFEKFTDESRFLDIDEMIGYRDAIDNMDTQLRNVHHGGHTLKNEFWEDAQKAVKQVETYENKVKKKIKHHRMDTGVNNNRKILKNYINEWKNKDTNTRSNNINRDPDAYEQAKNSMGSGDSIDLNTGDIKKADGTIIKKDGTIIDPNTNATNNDDFDYENASDTPFEIEDFDDESLANLTDDQILDQAQTNEDLEKFVKMRDDARAKLGMENQTFNTDTGNKTINNNFNGVNQERQQQRQKNEQQQSQQRGNQEQQQRQEETKKVAEESIGDTNTTKETPKGNIDEETLKKRRIEKQQRSNEIKKANRRLKGKTGEQLKNRSKGALRRARKKGKLTGNKFKVKGGNLKQAVANTLVNVAVNEVAEEAAESLIHPNMFNSLDQFADMSNDDMKYWADKIENEDLRTQRKKEWRDKRRQAKNERAKQNKIDKEKEIEDKINDIHEQYKSGNYKQDISPEQKAKMHKVEFEVDENGSTIIKKNKLLGGAADGDDIFGWMKKHNIGLGEAINVISTIGTYKDARKQGKSVVSSIASAAGTFVKGELLGFWGTMGWELAKGIPKMAIKGAETLYKENRKMNSAANQQVFGGAQFQDTQQLATMRQSGMEMAKMAQYNLQQTLMGAEATHLHR